MPSLCLYCKGLRPNVAVFSAQRAAKAPKVADRREAAAEPDDDSAARFADETTDFGMQALDGTESCYQFYVVSSCLAAGQGPHMPPPGCAL